MVQSSQQRLGDDLALARRIDRAWLRTILLQSSMGAMPVKIVEVIGQHAVKMSGMKHQHVVQTLTADGAD